MSISESPQVFIDVIHVVVVVVVVDEASSLGTFLIIIHLPSMQGVPVTPRGKNVDAAFFNKIDASATVATH